MAIVSFALTDEGVASFQNALACILRFSEDVSVDARKDKASGCYLYDPHFLVL